MSATKSGNELQKTCNIVLSVSYTVFILFFDFSVAFVVREEKSLIDKGLTVVRNYKSCGEAENGVTMKVTPFFCVQG